MHIALIEFELQNTLVRAHGRSSSTVLWASFLYPFLWSKRLRCNKCSWCIFAHTNNLDACLGSGHGHCRPLRSNANNELGNRINETPQHTVRLPATSSTGALCREMDGRRVPFACTVYYRVTLWTSCTLVVSLHLLLSKVPPIIIRFYTYTFALFCSLFVSPLQSSGCGLQYPLVDPLSRRIVGP